MAFGIRRDLRGHLVQGPLCVGIPVPTVLWGATQLLLDPLQKSWCLPSQRSVASLKSQSC